MHDAEYILCSIMLVVKITASMRSFSIFILVFTILSLVRSHKQENKKLSCRKETAQRLVIKYSAKSLRSLEMTQLRRACVSPY